MKSLIKFITGLGNNFFKVGVSTEILLLAFHKKYWKRYFNIWTISRFLDKYVLINLELCTCDFTLKDCYYYHISKKTLGIDVLDVLSISHDSI
jgi:hypothetical protein